MDAKTFDLSEMLSGINYPTVDVPVFLNEDLAFRIADLDERIAKHPEDEALETERESLVEEAKKFLYVVHLKGISRDTYLTALEQVTSEHKPETDSLGRLKPNPEGDAALERKLWALYIESVTDPSGRTVDGVSEEEAHGLIRNLPYTAVEAIGQGISDLSLKTRKGFEDLALETDFLSQR